MEQYFNVEWTVHNAESGAWASKVPDGGSDKDREVVRAFYHSECARLFGSADFDFVCVLYRDNFGRVLASDVKDVRVVPEPEPEAE